MKTTRNIALMLFMLSFCAIFSCREDINEITQEHSLPESAILNELARECSPLQVIQKYVNQKCLDTRVQGDDIPLVPIDYEGQTVMYIANYPNGGFDIFSADYHAPMVLVKSETGSFVPSDTTSIPEGFADVLDEFSKNIYDVSKTDGSIDNSWSFSNNRYPTIIDESINFDYRVDRSKLGEGYWISDTVKVIRYTPVINHLVQDHWHQKDPYNKYIKYVNFGDSIDHGLVGCSTIALVQFLHYWYKKTGHAPTMYSTATYDSISNKYIFSNPTNTIWSSLDNNIDSIAMVLGYVSDCISTSVNSHGTSSTMDSVSSFLSYHCEIMNTLCNYNESIIFNQITNFCPTIASASGQQDGKYYSHCFLIDGCKNQQEAIAIRNRWYEPVDNGDHSVSQYILKDVEYKLLEVKDDYYFTVNWGFGVSWYDRLWFNGTTRWVLKDGFYWNNFRKIIKIEE